jgi:hypothetical protein
MIMESKDIDRENRIIVAKYNPRNMCGDGLLFMGRDMVNIAFTPNAPLYDEIGNIIGTIISIEETANNGEILITAQINSEEAWQYLKDRMLLPEGA